MTRSPSPRRVHLARRGGWALPAAFLLCLVGAGPAAAHPYLLGSDPPSGSVLRSAPTRIDLTYTEGLDRPYSNVVLIDPDGRRITTHQVAASGPAELAVTPDLVLSAQGTYAVEWTAVGDDGHTVIGSFPISIGHPSANAAVSGAGAGAGPRSSGGLEGRLRIGLPLATVVFAGVMLLGEAVLGAGRRTRRLLVGSWAAQTLLTLALGASLWAEHGLRGLGSADTGRRLLATLVLSLLAAPLVLRRPTLLRNPGARRVAGRAIGGALLAVLAVSSHASTQPSSRRALALGVYWVHLLATAVWVGAILAVALRLRRSDGASSAAGSSVGATERSLRPLVVTSLLATLGTGLATTDWGLRTLSDVGTTVYGRLAIAKLALYGLLVCVGAAALGAGRGPLRRAGEAFRARLLAGEVLLAMSTLVVAGVLGQVAQPRDEPYPSQTYATTAGMPVAVASAGPDSLDVATLAPGVVGSNSLVVLVGESDEQDFLHPADDVAAVTATVSCTCGVAERHLTLSRTGGGMSWTAALDLDRPATWLFRLVVTRADGRTDAAVNLAERVTPARLPRQEVIGVPADLSGPSGRICRDQILGAQAALADVNATAADHGNLVRVVVVNLGDGAPAAMARLAELDAKAIALPCGSPAQVSAVVAGARAAHLPVILGASPGAAVAPGVWSVLPDWQREGAAIGEQARRQGAHTVTAVVGTSALDRSELVGFRGALGPGVALEVVGVPAHPSTWARTFAGSGPDLLALLVDPHDGTPLLQAISRELTANRFSIPQRGILASARLMSTDVINDSGSITRQGGVEFASDLNPFDPVAQHYAQRLRTLTPGIRPSFDGVHGYYLALALTKALAAGGGRPSPAALERLLGDRFTDFAVGSSHLGWRSGGGTATSLAFFRTTYINPMAMPSTAPGGATSMSHEGTFLDSGGFEQVAPFRSLS